MIKFFRIIYILYILYRYRILDVFGNKFIIKFINMFNYLNPFYLFDDKRKLDLNVRIRLALEKLGPIFVKFGQALSTRPDILPSYIIKELVNLQDNVKPFPNKIAFDILKKTYKSNFEETFKSIDENVLGSGSIAQVYGATLFNNKEVIIKILRPNIDKVLKKDTSILLVIAKIIEKFIPDSERLKPIEVVKEINKNLFYELDLLREASNCSQLKRNFKNQEDLLYVPSIYWDYCRKNILVMERIYGINSDEVNELRKNNFNLQIIAEKGVEVFYTQVFRDCFFHADMHAGNIFIDPNRTENPRYISIDFGIMGSLTREDQYYLASNFLAFFQRDYKKVAELHIESNWVPLNTRIDELEMAIRTVCEPIFEKPLKDISFGQTLLRLFEVAREFNMSVQPQLILLQKTLLNVEGMGRLLYPNLNLWQTAKPFLEKWMKKQVGAQGFYNRVLQHIPKLSEKLPDLPDLVLDILYLERERKQSLELQYKNEKLNNSKKDKKPFKNPFIFLTFVSILSINTISIFYYDFWQNFIKLYYANLSIITISIVFLFLYFINKEKN